MALTKIPSSLLDTSGGFDLQGNITLGDNEQIQLGDSTDLAIYHDGSNSYIKENGIGNLYVQGQNHIFLTNSDGSKTYFAGNSPTGWVKLYHDNSIKFETTSTGATVTGNLAVTGDLDITGNVNSASVTDLDVTDKTITLGAGQTEALSGGSGIIIDGSSASILWDETNTEWDFNNSINVTGTAQATRLGLGNAPHATAPLHITTTNQHIRLNNGSELGAISVLSTGELDIWGHGDGETINFRTGSGVGTVAMNVVGTNVGIGTDSPGEKLVVAGDGARITVESADMEVAMLGRRGSSGAALDDGYLRLRKAGVTADGIVLNTGGSSWLNGGNVGIGTSSPKTTLNLAANNSGQGPILTLENTDTSITSNDVIGQIDFYANDGSTNGTGAKVNIKGIATSTAGTITALTFGTADSASSTATEKMRIDASGNLFIGGTSSTSKPTGLNKAIYLQSQTDNDVIGYSLYTNEGTNNRRASFFLDDANGVYGFDASAGTGVPSFVVNGNGNERMRILSSGNVGIGTSNPQMGLHVGSGTQSTAALAGIGIANGGSAYSFYSASDGTKQYIAGIDHTITYTKAGSLSNHSHAIVSNNTIRLFCKNDGFLGIGDVDPDSTVHIKNSTAGGPQIHMDDGTNSAFINFDGTSLQLSTQRDMVDGTWHNTAKSWGGINIVGGTGGSEITMTTATGPNTAPVTRCKLDQNGRFYFGGTASFAHNTYGHSLVATGNSVPNGVVVMEDSDVSSGIGNTVLNLYLRDQDPATYAVYIDFRDGGGRVGSITHNDDGGGVTYNTTSDYRLKENVNYTWDALPLLTQLKPAKFNFIGKTDKTRQGFLAHEVMDIVPGSVKGNKDQMEPIGTITDNNGNVVDEGVYEHFCKIDEGQTWTQTGTEPLYQELDYSRLVPLLTKAIQELNTKLEAAEARITELEG